MHRAIRSVVVALAATTLLVASSALARGAEQNYTWQLFHATNQSRTSHGVHRVDRAFRMSKVAERHSERMARHRRLWHTAGPTRYGAHCYTWGENVGWTSGSIADLERAFMASAGHRAHILDRSFDRVGVGTAKAGRTLWVTVFFCT